MWNSTLRRKTPMKRTSFKQTPPWIKKMADKKAEERGGKFVKRKGQMVYKKSTLKKQSKSLRNRLSNYYPISKAFLVEHPYCQICPCLGRIPNPATEIHHSRGRMNKLLCDVRFFVASCRECRQVPHENPAWAREHGLLSSATDWNTYPVDNQTT